MATRTNLVRLALAAALALAGCSKQEEGGVGQKEPGAATKATTGETVRIDGSSTVFPVSQAVAEEFQKKHGGRVTIGVSGTGGGFKKFCRAEIAVTGASRPIKPTEREECARGGVEFVELPIAYDGLAVVIHKDNDWAETVTVAELKKMWEPEAQGTIKKWSQIRDGWPDQDFRLFGPGVDSGTFDYFTAAIVGKEHASRGDFTASEDDNVLVQGVISDRLALGFFGYAYYKENADKLKVVAIDDGSGRGPVAPSLETVMKGTYQPLSRPIFIYVNIKEAARPEIDTFVHFYLNEGRALVEEVGYIPLPEEAYKLAVARFKDRVKGSLFEGGSKVGVTIEEILGGGK